MFFFWIGGMFLFFLCHGDLDCMILRCDASGRCTRPMDVICNVQCIGCPVVMEG